MPCSSCLLVTSKAGCSSPGRRDNGAGNVQNPTGPRTTVSGRGQAFRPEPQAPTSNAPTLDHNLGAEDRCEEPDLPKETAKTIQARYDGLKKPRCSVAHWGIWRQTNPTPHKRFVPDLRTHKVTLDDKSFRLDRLFSHDATPGDIFAELEPWVLHLSSKLAERKYHCLVLLAFGFSGLGKTRVMTGDAAGGPFTLDTSVIGCTSELLFKNKPPEFAVVGRLIEICPGEKNKIEVYTFEKGRATVSTYTLIVTLAGLFAANTALAASVHHL
ncbi:uncharacterized protein J4E88_010153 [Alternaria novae-zelandiae]|uniref:uncharacterized protein n=1 Tax=Alternaria novae-zelandiae TaxID=430562 RepID=UPI0020C41124|nr:uncharacterized protein J4E88_010153 [Alternaria novae-zelandiae]KAI4667752.1 hypothetical protein J4E88_010153 [Alternaria novae-zelandiae]